MPARERFFRYFILMTLLLTIVQAARPEPRTGAARQVEISQPAGAPPAGISAQEWDQILSQVQAEMADVTYDPLITSPVKKLSAVDGISGDSYGFSVAISGDTAVVGAYLASVDGKAEQGAAYIYARNWGGAAENWGMVKKLVAEDGAAADNFGASVAICEGILVVGAPGAAIDAREDQGAAYVFYRNDYEADQWYQVRKVIAIDGAAGDHLGEAAAISGHLVALGADDADVEGVADQGAVYLFKRNEGNLNNWGQYKKLSTMDGEASDFFGGALALINDTLVVGARGYDGMYSNQGAAYVFERNWGGVADNWGQVKKLTAYDGFLADSFGRAVALNGQADMILVGAPYVDSELGLNHGAVYLFYRNDEGLADSWGVVKKLVANDGTGGDNFGSSVGISQGRALVGAKGDDSGRGAVYRLERNQGGLDEWGSVEKFQAGDGTTGDQFGSSVAINLIGDISILGAPGDDSGRGATYVYSWHGIAWQEISKKPISGDYSGAYSVAISGDTLAVGSPHENFGEFLSPGVVYLFTRNQGGTDAWGLLKKLNASDYTDYESFGWDVDLDGDTLVVAAIHADIDGQKDAGAVYVFSRNFGGPDSWGEVKKLTYDFYGVPTAYDSFGYAVAISGDTLAVGVPNRDTDDGIDSGSVLIFRRNAGGIDDWGVSQSLPMWYDLNAGDEFGHSVDFSGNTLVVGAPGTDIFTEANAGAAYLFVYRSSFEVERVVIASNYDQYNDFGSYVSISGDTLAVGTDYLWSVYIYSRNQGGADVWGEVKNFPGFGSDHGGLAISGDTLMIGSQKREFVYELHVFSRNQGGVDAWGELMMLRPSVLEYEWLEDLAMDGSTVVAGAQEEVFVFQEVSAGVYLPVIMR